MVGHVAFSPVRIEGVDLGWLGLGPVSVAPSAQRRGIGTALVEAGLARIRADGAAGCVVLGDPAFYRRFGFTADPALRYGDVPPAYFQSQRFRGPAPRGAVAYHPAFGGRPDGLPGPGQSAPAAFSSSSRVLLSSNRRTSFWLS